MKKKPLTPYQRLLDDARKWADKITCPKTVHMWTYPRNKLQVNWSLSDLYERTKAAEQLGYDVIIIATEEGLEVKYQIKKPEIPWSLQYK